MRTPGTVCDSCKGGGTTRVGSRAAGETQMTYRDITCSGCRGTGVVLDRYTDEYLTATYETWVNGGMGLTAQNPAGWVVGRGDAAVARVLLKAPYEVRQEIEWEAGTRTNYVGGRVGDAAESALREWERTGTFPYRDRAAAHRKAENDLNAALRAQDPGAARVILPMN